jgi:hypothetical protein
MTRLGIRIVRGCAVIGALSLGLTQDVRAGLLQVTLSDNLGHSLTVVDGSANDNDPTANSISVTTSVLLADFPELVTGSSVSVSSDQGSADPFRQIVSSATLVRANDGLGVVQFVVDTTQNGFANPVGDPKMLSAVFTGNFSQAPTSNNSKYDGSSDPGNVIDTPTVALPTIGPFSSTGLPLNAFSGTSGPASFTSSLYSLTGVATTNTSANATVNYSGTTRVDAFVPEPASVLLMAFGSPLIVRALRRKTKKQADA